MASGVTSRAPRGVSLLLMLVSIVGSASVMAPTAARAAAPALQPGSRPNIILIITDDQTVQTAEYMDHISGPDWTDFSNYYVNTSLCCPSRATMLSGQYSHHTGVEISTDGPRFDDHNTIATWLHRVDYRTGMFGKYLNDFPWRLDPSYVPPGWDQWVSFYREPGYYDYRLSVDGRLRRRGHRPADYSTDLLARRTVQFIRESESRDGDPFFAVYAPYAPHGPRTPAPRDRHFTGAYPAPRDNFNERAINEKPDWVRALGYADASEQRRRQRGEVITLQPVDDAVAELEQTLRETGELDDTVIFYVSDNGISYGSHRIIGKECNYEECVHVPMRIRATGLGEGRIESFAANMDLAPTMAQLAGTTPSIPVDGVSLLPLLNGGSEVRNDVLLHLGRELGRYSWGLVNDRYKYIDNRQGGIELYDLALDPYELVDRSKADAYRSIREDLAQRVTELRRTGKPR